MPASPPTPERGRLAGIVAVALAGIGIVVSAVLELVHVRANLGLGNDSVCTQGPTLDCNAVALSRFAVVAGVPLPVWGLAGFVGIAFAAVRGSRLLLPLSAIATLVSILLVTEELVHVHKLCWLCSLVHVVSAALLFVAWRRAASGPVRPLDALGSLGLPLAIVVAARLAIPPYWVTVSWIGGVSLPHGVDAEGHPWIGAETPTVTVEEWVDYRCPHCAAWTRRTRALLLEHPTRLRVVRRHVPGMACRKVPRGTPCLHVRAALCALAQDKFWEMDSWLFMHAPGRGYTDVLPAIPAVGLERDAFERCLEDDATYERATAEHEAARAHKFDYTPSYRVDGVPTQPREVEARVEANR